MIVRVPTASKLPHTKRAHRFVAAPWWQPRGPRVEQALGSLRRGVRRTLTGMLERYGYVVRPSEMPPRGYQASLAFARRCGICPRTVFDVGVGRGTPWLYDAFPGAGFVLVEALETFRPDVESIAARLGASYHITALGRAPGRVRMRVPRLSSSGASLMQRAPEFTRVEGTASRNTMDDHVDVPVTTLDLLSKQPGPYLIKLDVEGAEMEVLRGATEVLRQTELVVLEMSILKRFADEPSFAERIAYMDQVGFELFDMPALAQTSGSGPLSFIDAVFVRKDNRLRIPGW